MIFGAHLDSLTQEPLCDSRSNCNHCYSADAISSSHPQHGTPVLLFSSRFPTAISGLPLPCCFSSFFHIAFTPSSLFPIPNPTTYTSFPPRLPCFPYEPASFTPCLLPPSLADCECLQVSCGHFSFIILSKSGMTLVRGDWVSVKHQELIEFVLKWVIAGTLLMQS